MKNLLFIVFICVVFGCNNSDKENKIDKQASSLQDHLGEKFVLTGILDSSGKEAKLDFSKSELTIIDFWFNGCPPCIEELNHFAALLPGKEAKVSIISISINQPWLWKETLMKPEGKFSFLKNHLSNWTHYVLQTQDSKELKNDVSADRLAELEQKFNVSFFPGYFIVDKNGVIKRRPQSAVEFIKEL